MMKGLAVGMALASLAAASVGGLAIAAHDKPLPRRRKPVKRTPPTEEQLAALRLEQEQARQRGNERKEAAERKRHKKAQQRAALATKGAIQIVVEALSEPEPAPVKNRAKKTEQSTPASRKRTIAPKKAKQVTAG